MDAVISFVFDLIQKNLWSVVGGFSLVIYWLFQNWFRHTKLILFEGEQFFNINNSNGLPERNSPNEKYFSNFIMHQLTIHNKREISQAITKIKLFNIEKIDKKFSDIQFDGGFYDTSQKFVLLAYNNGNDLSEKIIRYVRINSYEDRLQNETLLGEIKINVDPIESGNLVCLYEKKFFELADKFTKNLNLYSLSIELFDENYTELNNLKTFLIFDRRENKFRNTPKGASFPPVEQLPIFYIEKSTSEITLSCSQELQSGNNNIEYLILVNETCSLDFNLSVFVGDKEFVSKQKFHLDVRLPIYRQEHGSFLGSFYFLLKSKENQINRGMVFTMEQISILEKNLIYDKYGTAKKFYNVKL